jgi:hypothetical protein
MRVIDADAVSIEISDKSGTTWQQMATGDAARERAMTELSRRI